MDEKQAWLDEINRRRRDGVDLQFDPRDFASQMGVEWPDKTLSDQLEELVGQETLQKLKLKQCPNQGCQEILGGGALNVGECPACQFQFLIKDEAPVEVTRYRIVGEASRDIRWMIVIHGFNTRGPWQEDLSWLIANKLRYSAPVLIYKYGWATIDVLSRPLQDGQVKSLGNKVRQAVSYARKRGLPCEPDIVAHSFGSHLFARLLNDPEFKDLKFGRIITVGSIVRPDFDWSSLAESRRIQGVLNHMGGKDQPVLFAQYMIPGAGPGARIGYLDPFAINHRDASFSHSTALEANNLRDQFGERGLWDRFLTQPTGNFEADDSYRPVAWSPAWIGFRAITRLVGWTIILLVGPFSWLRRKIDP